MRQKGDIEFNVEMKCISVIHYISNHLKQYSYSFPFLSLSFLLLPLSNDSNHSLTLSLSLSSLPLSIVTRLLNTHGKSVIVCVHFFK